MAAISAFQASSYNGASGADNRNARRIGQLLDGLRDHLRADPVAGEQRDPVRQAAAPTFPGTLSR